MRRFLTSASSILGGAVTIPRRGVAWEHWSHSPIRSVSSGVLALVVDPNLNGRTSEVRRSIKVLGTQALDREGTRPRVTRQSLLTRSDTTPTIALPRFTPGGPRAGPHPVLQQEDGTPRLRPFPAELRFAAFWADVPRPRSHYHKLSTPRRALHQVKQSPVSGTWWAGGVVLGPRASHLHPRDRSSYLPTPRDAVMFPQDGGFAVHRRWGPTSQ